jgi:uncharacterized protein YozE (UPF0346 family)
MTFWRFLQQQRTREDAVGRFARAALLDPQWPRRARTCQAMAEYLDLAGAPFAMRRAFGQACAEWLRNDTGEHPL